MNKEQGNKLIVKNRELLKLVEKFMGYDDGYLSEIITWNELMPVVEKISKDYDFRIVWYNEDCIATVTNRSLEETEITSSGNYEPHILNVWRCVIQFIQWYNNQNKPT